MKSFLNEKKNLTISCESMECVYYNKKKNLLPKYLCTLHPQEGVLGLLGDLGTRPTPPEGAAPALAPTAPDLKPHLLHGPSSFPHAHSLPVLTCSRHCSSLTISCLLPLLWSLPSVGPRSSATTVLTVTPIPRISHHTFLCRPHPSTPGWTPTPGWALTLRNGPLPPGWTLPSRMDPTFQGGPHPPGWAAGQDGPLPPKRPHPPGWTPPSWVDPTHNVQPHRQLSPCRLLGGGVLE